MEWVTRPFALESHCNDRRYFVLELKRIFDSQDRYSKTFGSQKLGILFSYDTFTPSRFFDSIEKTCFIIP